MQLHHVSLEDAVDGMRLLGKAGLSTREACGNTVRNVVGCPMAGICPDEVFDITPYLAAYVRWAVRHPLTQNFPRKFKTAFSGCVDHDCIIAPIHDLSFIAQLRNGKRGFKVIFGGGTSIMARMGQVLYEFCPVEDYLRVSQAIWTVFNNSDMLRKNRMMARIKVLIARIGFDAVKEQVEEELQKIGPIDPTPFMNIEEIAKENPPEPTASDAVEHPAEFLKWKETNTVEQKQSGYYGVDVNVPLGDVFANQFNKIANIVRNYTGGRARVTQDQNITLRWVPESYLFDVWKALKEIDLAEPGVHSISDVVSCPGTDSCKLGITSSMGLARPLRESLIAENGKLDDPLVQQMHIKMSGCPNGCGQHHIANIGFQGGALKGVGGQIPAYEIFLGGNYGGKLEATRLAQRIPRIKVPAKRAPQLVKAFVSYYRGNRKNEETFNQFFDRVGVDSFASIASEYKEPVPLDKDTEGLYLDWEKGNLYKVERGEGECAV